MGKNANAKLFVLQKLRMSECLTEKAHMGLHMLTDRKYFLFFPPQNGQEQRFLFLIAVEMTKIPFMGPMVIPNEACSSYFTE